MFANLREPSASLPDNENCFSVKVSPMLQETSLSPLARAQSFAQRHGIRLHILLAPMAGACPPSLSIAVANAGGLGACGALLMSPNEIAAWAAEFRAKSQGAFQINLWIPGPAPQRHSVLEDRQREFLAAWGPSVPPQAGDAALPDFEEQC
jgi:nitronate monooxygenase